MIELAIAMMAGSGLVKSIGLFKKAQGQAALERLEAQLDDQAAQDAEIRGKHEAGLLRQQASKVLSDQRLEYAHAGVDVDSGTPLDVQAETTAIGELNAKLAVNNAAREAWGYRVQAAVHRKQADLTEEAGKWDAIGSILGTGGSIAGMGGRGA